VPAIPGQQTIDGDEVPAVGEQLGLMDVGGKRPQSATLTLVGAKADVDETISKGDRVFFAGQAQVTELAVADKVDSATMIPMEAVQKHKAKVFELHTGDEEQVLIGLFRALVGADRQRASVLADAFVREASGG
jgi:hypothetical protein